ISENNLGIRIKKGASDVRDLLNQLHDMRVVQYQEQTDLPFISFPTERLRPESIILDKAFINATRRRFLEKMNSIIAYAENDLICRSIQLVSYFGDDTGTPCGKCDVCLENKRKSIK